MKMDGEEVGCYYYEARLPLENDPDLKNAGVQVIARVVLEKNGESHNRLGFARGYAKQFVECIHTAIFSATPEKLAKLAPRDYRKILRTTEGHPAILPPWEHFVSLKSFAAGLVARGVLSTLFGLPARSLSEDYPGDGNLEIQERGESGIFSQLSDVLYDIAAEIVDSLLMEQVGDIIEQAPEDWIRTHAEPLCAIKLNYCLVTGHISLAWMMPC